MHRGRKMSRETWTKMQGQTEVQKQRGQRETLRDQAKDFSENEK